MQNVYVMIVEIPDCARRCQVVKAKIRSSIWCCKNRIGFFSLSFTFLKNLPCKHSDKMPGILGF